MSGFIEDFEKHTVNRRHVSLGRFHSHGQWLCKFIGTKEIF